MKFLTRVVLLAILLSSCSESITITSNADATAALELHPNSRGNGVILSCKKDICAVLTVAHLCHPFTIADSIMQDVMRGEASEEEAVQELATCEELAKEGLFCNGYIMLNNEQIPVTAVTINFDIDLMLMVMINPNIASRVEVSETDSVEPGGELYTVVITPTRDHKVILYSKAGLTYVPDVEDYETREDQAYLQTDFPIGPGASGAPVFDDHNLLVGIIGAQLLDGSIHLPIKATYTIPAKVIREILNQYVEDKNKNDSESDWPYCHGEERICQVVRGEASFLDVLGHRPLPEASSENASKIPRPANEPRGPSVDNSN